jgi:hypothetical protein
MHIFISFFPEDETMRYWMHLTRDNSELLLLARKAKGLGFDVVFVSILVRRWHYAMPLLKSFS